MSLWTKNGETKEKLSKRVQRRENGKERNIEESGKYSISSRAGENSLSAMCLNYMVTNVEQDRCNAPLDTREDEKRDGGERQMWRGKGCRQTSHLSLSPQPSLFIPDGGRDRHVDEHRRGERLGGALRDHVRYTLYCEVCHGLQPVHSHIEILREGADVVHGRHLEEQRTK